MARTTGSRNVKSIDRDVRALRMATTRVLVQRCATRNNKKSFRTAIDRLHDDAAKGDRGALRMLMEIRSNLYSQEAADHVARLVGAPDLGKDYTMSDAAMWIVKTLPQIESTEGLREFLNLSVRLFQLAAERERVDAMRQAAVPTRQVHAIVMAFNLVVQETLADPTYVHLLELFTDKVKHDVIPRFPEIFEYDNGEKSAC